MRKVVFRSWLAALAVATLTLSAVAPAAATRATSDAFRVQLVTVDTPTRADKELLTQLGLDLTEHAGHDYIEVVLHSPAEEAALEAAGFTWDVRIPDMAAREAEIRRENEAFAAATKVSALPSGRDTYRTLEDYNTELSELAKDHPGLVKAFELSQTSLEGKAIHGIEIAANVNGPADGRPVFAMFGLHHAREWPSGEHTIEFAYDLVENYGKNARITRLLRQSRVLIVPVVNVDGFEKSINDGLLVDLRPVDDDNEELDGTASLLGTPGNAYKRKNCRVMDGSEPAAAECTLASSPGGLGIGVDLNRNYGGLWGGPGASDSFEDATYRGADAFSEPETQAVRELVSRRQVTMLITNHTFSNLVLRPNGVAPDTLGPDEQPVGDPPDEAAMKRLGAQMAAQNGYRNIHGWQLYDTTGTTEDWSYNATGGFGYTFEIGPDEFHPPYPEVIDEYLGAGFYKGKGNRAAYLIALENAVSAKNHSIIGGTAPAGATLRLKKTFATPTWEGSFNDTLETTMVVGPNGQYVWHVNPSTRPLMRARQYRETVGGPIRTETWTGTTAPRQRTHQELVLAKPVDMIDVTLDWPTPDDLDLVLYRVGPDGALIEEASSGNFVGDKERAVAHDLSAGKYVLEVHNYASVSPTWELTASMFDQVERRTKAKGTEAWTLTCERGGRVLQTVKVTVDRGERANVNLSRCFRRR
jgi:hypothetical protein